MKHTQDGFIGVAVIAILALGLIGGGYYVATRAKTTPVAEAPAVSGEANVAQEGDGKVPETTEVKAGMKTEVPKAPNVPVQVKVSSQVNIPIVTAPAAGSVSISGTVVCLPAKNAAGAQNASCALGLKDDRGNYYALQDTDPNYKNVSGVSGNANVTVRGTFTPGSNAGYSTVGTIAVTGIVK